MGDYDLSDKILIIPTNVKSRITLGGLVIEPTENSAAFQSLAPTQQSQRPQEPQPSTSMTETPVPPYASPPIFKNLEKSSRVLKRQLRERNPNIPIFETPTGRGESCLNSSGKENETRRERHDTTTSDSGSSPFSSPNGKVPRLSQISTQLNKEDKAVSTDDELGSPNKKPYDQDIDSDGEFEEFDIDGDFRGYGLIFNHYSFMGDKDSKPKKREGTDVDAKALQELFQQIGLKPLKYDDRNKEEVLEILENIVKKDDQKDAKMFMIAILSHGDENGILTFNQLRMDLDHDLIPKLYRSSAPHLVGKPKIILAQVCIQRTKSVEFLLHMTLFIFQACRGRKLDSGSVATHVLDCSPMSKNAFDHRDVDDIFIFYPSAPLYQSIRHPDKGTFLVQSFVKIIRKYSEKYHFGDLADLITKDVKKKTASIYHPKTGKLVKGVKVTPERRKIGFERRLYLGKLRPLPNPSD